MDLDVLKREMVGCCTQCGGSGYLSSGVCDCLIKFRAYNRLISSGFSKRALDIVSSSEYQVPMFGSTEEEEALSLYVQNPSAVLSRGLSLYIFSAEYGRGKTTLAHYVAYLFARHFLRTANYLELTARGRNREDLFVFGNIKEVLERKSSYYAPFLVIDDMGNEDRSASWIRESALATFQRLFHAREDRSLPTIITSNYTPLDIDGKYNGVLMSLLTISPEGQIQGHKFRQIEVVGGEDLRVKYSTDGWEI